jgi:hypothetical protein
MQPDQVTEGEYRVITHPRPEADVHGISRNNYLMLSDFVPGPILRLRTTVFTA